MGFWDSPIEDLLLGPATRLLLEGIKALFGGADDGGHDLTSVKRVNQILYGNGGSGVPSLSGPPPVPAGPGGLQQGAGQAGSVYQQAGDSVAMTDEKLAGLLRQIFASNDEMRSKVMGVITEITTKHQQLAADANLANDPMALKVFQQFVDGKLGELQQLLDNAKVDGAKQAELLAALGDEYRNSAGGEQRKNANADGSDGNDVGHGGDGAGANGGGPVSGGGDPGGGAAGVVDPLAGMGPLGGAMGVPLSMLGPALTGLGSALPSAVGGAGGALPLDSLGSLATLVSQFAGHGTGDGSSDDGSRDRAKPADFVDDGHGKSDDGANKTGDAGNDKSGDSDKNSGLSPASAVPLQQPTPTSAVPASSAGDLSRVVQMPDGSSVTASSPQSAAAMHAVLNGSTVTDGWKTANVDLPPPGTPITTPADPSHLVPAAIAQFKSREPVMYMGNGKIWLDGQLQSQSALPMADFLGWLDPAQLVGSGAAPSPGSRVPAGV